MDFKIRYMNSVCTKETLSQLFVSVFDNRDIDLFNPNIIDLILLDGWVLELPFNALNTAICLAGQYIESFADEKKLIAEQKAINVLDIMIKSGAKPFINKNQKDNTLSIANFLANNNRETITISIARFLTNYNQEANTLSIAMRCANINILKFLIDANLELKPCDSKYICVSGHCTLYCAFKASQKTQNPEFLRIALINGALPQYDWTDSIEKILESGLISMIDFIVFGGDEFVRFFFLRSPNTLLRQQPTEELIEQFEMCACLCDIPLLQFEYYCFSYPVASSIIVDKYRSLLAGWYLKYDKNDYRYKEPAEMKQRLESKSRLMIETAMTHDKCSERRTTIGNAVLSLPISCTDIIAEYEYTPRFNVIDWANFKQQ